MKAILRLAHITRFENSACWDKSEIKRLAKEALHDDDIQRLEIARLRKIERATPRFQGMNELA